MPILSVYMFSVYVFSYIFSPRSRSKSKSKSPKRKRTPSPKPTKITVGRLTRNIHKGHISEIFATYGSVKSIEVPTDPIHRHLPRGFAYVEYEKPDEAEKALKYMDGG